MSSEPFTVCFTASKDVYLSIYDVTNWHIFDTADNTFKAVSSVSSILTACQAMTETANVFGTVGSGYLVSQDLSLINISASNPGKRYMAVAFNTRDNNSAHRDPRLDIAIAAMPFTVSTSQLVNDANVIQNNTTVDGTAFQTAMAIIAASVAGEVSGAGTGTEVFKGLDGSTSRITVTADASGNRTAVSYP